MKDNQKEKEKTAHKYGYIWTRLVGQKKPQTGTQTIHEDATDLFTVRSVSHKTQNKAGKAFPLHVYIGYFTKQLIKLFERCEIGIHF